jgi:N-hydroxyarylamine O-acetyltransferase
MHSAIDLEAYFHRIGYTGPSEATLEVLHDIAGSHAASIPFENIDVLLGRGITLDLEAIEQKLVYQHRGGYCFEQNQLLGGVLTQLGFSVAGISARVRWMLPREVTPPRTHLFLRVDLPEGPWIADVGVGGCSATRALHLVADKEQETPHDTRRFIRLGDLWLHQIRFTPEGEWLDVCEFTGEPMPDIDRIVANWWTSTHPDSKFRKNLIVSRAQRDGCRWSLHNRELTLYKPHHAPERHSIESHAQLRETLASRFDLHLQEEERFPLLELA